MNNNRKRRITAFLILCMIIAFFTGSPGGVGTVHAASAAIVLSCKGSTIQKGTDFTVTITVRSTETIGQVQLYLSYDESIFEYKKGGNYVSGGNGFVEISDTSVKNTSVRKYTVTFDTIGTGTAKTAVCENPAVTDASGNDMSVSSNFISITAKEGAEKSKDCMLEALSCREGELVPAFTPECYAYELQVNHEVEKLNFDAKARSKKATAVLSGDKLLHDGENLVKITVTAQAGNSQDYLIYVNRTTREEETVESAKQEGFLVTEEDNRVSMVSYHTYELKELPDGAKIPNGYVETEKNVKGEKITAYVPKGNEEAAFYLVYASCEGGGAGFYQVDGKEGTLQRYDCQEEKENEIEKDGAGQLSKEKGTVLLTGGVIAVFAMFFFICFLAMKRNKD